jgi:hypothetical protein
MLLFISSRGKINRIVFYIDNQEPTNLKKEFYESFFKYY